MAREDNLVAAFRAAHEFGQLSLGVADGDPHVIAFSIFSENWTK
jgi:hypothetical protein